MSMLIKRALCNNILRTIFLSRATSCLTTLQYGVITRNYTKGSLLEFTRHVERTLIGCNKSRTLDLCPALSINSSSSGFIEPILMGPVIGALLLACVHVHSTNSLEYINGLQKEMAVLLLCRNKCKAVGMCGSSWLLLRRHLQAWDLKNVVFWDVKSPTAEHTHRHFDSTCCIYLN
jgi:hypothetical protein